MKTMAFVKLDTGILNSTLWIEREQREIFITALLMAEPREYTEPVPQIKVGELEWTGFEAPPGWYGYVPAASFGIINRAGVDREAGMEALRRLGEPEAESRSKEFGGRRMIRMDGGFIILNYMKYRDKDHTAAERQRRLRERKRAVTRDALDVTRDTPLPSRYVTHADAYADAETERTKTPAKKKPSPESETLYGLYPRKVGKADALKAIAKALQSKPFEELLLAVQAFGRKCARDGTEERFIPHPATWFNAGRYDDQEFKPDYKVKPNGGTSGKGNAAIAALREALAGDYVSFDPDGDAEEHGTGRIDFKAFLPPSVEGKA